MPAEEIVRAESAHDMQLLIKNLLISASSRDFQEEIVYKSRRFGYRELLYRIQRLANVLDDIGTPSVSTVAVMDWDSHRYLECYFTIPCTGRVLQTVNIRLSPEQIQYTLNCAQADTLVINRDFLEILVEILPGLETVRRMILIDESAESLPTEIEFLGEYEALTECASSIYDFPDFSEHCKATIFFTTGTTGCPKGVYYSHRQIVLHVMATLATFGTASPQGRIGNEDVYMPITPMFHAHAWGWPYAATLIGLRQVYPGAYDPTNLLKLFRDEGVTFSHCVPTLLHMILTDPESYAVDFKGRKFLLGGSSIPSSLVRLALDRGIDLFTGYGMSETGPVQVINHLTRAEIELPLDQQLEMRRRAGFPVMFCDVRTVDEEGNALPRDGITAGEIVFRSPWLTQGYHRDSASSEQLWCGGWLHSGDIGIFNKDGSLVICDRKKDVIKSGGEWISSLELESLLSMHPDISEVAVVAESDEKWGERPLALIVPESGNGKTLRVKEMQDYLMTFVHQGSLSKYAIPERFIQVDEIPKTSVGKLDKKRIRECYCNR